MQNKKQIVTVLQKLEEAVDKENKVVSKKKPLRSRNKQIKKKLVIKESVMQSIIDILNSTEQFGGASGPGINMTVGEVAKTAVGTVLGIGGLTAMHYGWNKLVAAIKSAPNKWKQVKSALMASKKGDTESLNQMGVSLTKKEESV